MGQYQVTFVCLTSPKRRERMGQKILEVKEMSNFEENDKPRNSTSSVN